MASWSRSCAASRRRCFRGSTATCVACRSGVTLLATRGPSARALARGARGGGRGGAGPGAVPVRGPLGAADAHRRKPRPRVRAAGAGAEGVAGSCARRRPRPRAARRDRLHGDLFRDNVLWRGGRIAALIDFESAARESYAFDLMVTILAWCTGDGLDPALARAMCEGYASVRPLTDAERRGLAGPRRRSPPCASRSPASPTTRCARAPRARGWSRTGGASRSATMTSSRWGRTGCETRAGSVGTARGIR